MHVVTKMARYGEDIVRSESNGERTRGSEPVDRANVVELYRTQMLARTFDEKAISLHGQGRIGTYAPMRGQEAAQVGATAAIRQTDYLLPTYRDHAMYLQRGFELEDVLLHLLGERNYIDHADPEQLRTFPITIPIATQLPHAVGLAMGAQYHRDDTAVLVSFGDGASSEGDFHEALNIAGVFEAPVVFFCQNNGYAISMPTDRQTASATIAQKARAYGFEGVRVDGNDVVAVETVIEDAIEAARNGEGPTLVEAVTYRQGPHTTTDDPSRYRDEDPPECRDRDPLAITRERLESAGGWTESDEQQLREWATDRVETAVENAEASTGLTPEEIFTHVYASETSRLRAQTRQLPDDPQPRR
jgi:pyruvate dehydrogenase E1 component alpha subunit